MHIKVIAGFENLGNSPDPCSCNTCRDSRVHCSHCRWSRKAYCCRCSNLVKGRKIQFSIRIFFSSPNFASAREQTLGDFSFPACYLRKVFSRNDIDDETRVDMWKASENLFSSNFGNHQIQQECFRKLLLIWALQNIHEIIIRVQRIAWKKLFHLPFCVALSGEANFPDCIRSHTQCT